MVGNFSLSLLCVLFSLNFSEVKLPKSLVQVRGLLILGMREKRGQRREKRNSLTPWLTCQRGEMSPWGDPRGGSRLGRKGEAFLPAFGEEGRSVAPLAPLTSWLYVREDDHGKREPGEVPTRPWGENRPRGGVIMGGWEKAEQQIKKMVDQAAKGAVGKDGRPIKGMTEPRKRSKKKGSK